MAEKYSSHLPEEAVKGFKDTAALILFSAFAVFAFIGFFVTAPLKRN